MGSVYPRSKTTTSARTWRLAQNYPALFYDRYGTYLHQCGTITNTTEATDLPILGAQLNGNGLTIDL